MRRIMFVENKSDGEARIGWVEYSKTGKTIYYRGRTLAKVGSGYKYNCIDEESGDQYWVSGPHKDGNDLLYGGVVEIDDDARETYWTAIRKQPQHHALATYRSGPSTRTPAALRLRPRGHARR
jgi:hypothetical protein